jgi:hypothetical protein
MLSPPNVSLAVGRSGGVAALFVGAKEVSWVEMTLAYDPALVQVLAAAPGALMTLDGVPVQTDRNSVPGREKVRLSRSSPVSGSGAILALTVQGTKAGSGSLTLEALTIGHAGGSVETVAPPAPARLVVAP